MSPDFSLYTNYPEAMQIWQVYRNRWCAAYWQSLGIKVIPTVGWSDSNSFKYAFLGIENNSTVAVSTVGILNNEISKMLFEDGFTEMINQINPENILIYGNKLEIFDQYENIKLFEPFHNKWSKKGG